jgi:hypothetical protein
MRPEPGLCRMSDGVNSTHGPVPTEGPTNILMQMVSRIVTALARTVQFQDVPSADLVRLWVGAARIEVQAQKGRFCTHDGQRADNFAHECALPCRCRALL